MIDCRSRMNYAVLPKFEAAMDHKAQSNDGHFWRITLLQTGAFSPASHDFRHVTLSDAPALGRLFFNAFKGTVDDTGQTETDYVSKAKAILDGRYGVCLTEASWVCEYEGEIQSACIVTDYKPYGFPVIAIVTTMPSEQGTGLAKGLIKASLDALVSLGHRQCCAKINDGNSPSRHFFARCGFLLTEVAP